MLAKSLDAQVIAEGIETYEQLEYLKMIDCEYGQGFFFSRPVDEDDIEEIIGIMTVPMKQRVTFSTLSG